MWRRYVLSSKPAPSTCSSRSTCNVSIHIPVTSRLPIHRLQHPSVVQRALFRQLLPPPDPPSEQQRRRRRGQHRSGDVSGARRTTLHSLSRYAACFRFKCLRRRQSSLQRGRQANRRQFHPLPLSQRAESRLLSSTSSLLLISRLSSGEPRHGCSVRLARPVSADQSALSASVLELLHGRCDETPRDECIARRAGQPRGAGRVESLPCLRFSVGNRIGWKGVAVLAESILRGDHLRGLRVLILHCLFALL